MAKKIRSLLSEIDKKFKESEEGIERALNLNLAGSDPNSSPGVKNLHYWLGD